jgi:CRISPR-associated endonuclease Cas1
MTYQLRSDDNLSRVRDGVLVVSGYGVQLAVEKGHLLVEGGIAGNRWLARFSRVDRQLKRVVLIGHAGSLTLDAIRWLHGVGVPLIHMDTDGILFGVHAPAGAQTARLRRLQALAPDLGLGTAISLDLVRAKIKGQIGVLTSLGSPQEALGAMEGALGALEESTTLKAIRTLEATAARAYWTAWRDLPLTWAPGQAGRRPRQWRAVGTRASFLSGFSPRKATNPSNAVLNYLFAILEAECQIACHAVGLDPLLGFLHLDTPSRASLPLDIMEPIRPRVEAWTLAFLKQHAFTSGETLELGNGECRLLPPLTTQLAATGPLWAPHAMEWATRVARRLSAHEGSEGPRSRRPKRVVNREYTRHLEPHEDSRRGPVVADKRRRAMRKVVKANRAWEHDEPVDMDPDRYQREVFPRLADVPLKTIVAATGLTMASCSLIRRGKMVPHPRHWRSLSKLRQPE